MIRGDAGIDPMGTQVDDERLMTVEDLMGRWGVSLDVVRRHAKSDGLPFVTLGRSAGRRPIIRFRPSAVRAWEAARERALEPGATGQAAIPQAAPAGWDGVDRTSRGRKGGGKPRPA
jgi:hypothetical protein